MFKKAGLTGLLLFGIFFGAGNLIFPPALGALSGDAFWSAISGFVLSGVGIAVLTLIIGALNPKGYVFEISEKISPLVAIIYLLVLYLAIGPFFAIPRTATAAYEVGIAPLLGDKTSQYLLPFTLIYFAAALLIALNPSKILDSVGRILTPLFAALILLLVVLGVYQYMDFPPANTAAEYLQSAFGSGFLEGYNTLDALASVAFSVIVVKTLRQLGFQNKRQYIITIWLVGIVVAAGFSLLYIGLALLGNHFPIPPEIMQSDINKGVYILSAATQAIFGHYAQWFLALMVSMTCFTTTVGLIVSCSEFFQERFPQLSYKHYALLFTLIGLAVANLGLNAIIRFSVPVLQLLYPITIVLVVLIIAHKFIPLAKLGMQLTVLLVGLTALADVIAQHFALPLLSTGIKQLPFAELAMAWVAPGLLGLLCAMILPNRYRSTPFRLE